jgi:hypothetical protein
MAGAAFANLRAEVRLLPGQSRGLEPVSFAASDEAGEGRCRVREQSQEGLLLIRQIHASSSLVSTPLGFVVYVACEAVPPIAAVSSFGLSPAT